jgi:hypothetical protein
VLAACRRGHDLHRRVRRPPAREAAAIGQFVNADSKREWVTTGHWQISVSGPGGFFANGENGELDAILPRAGAYTFEIGPCAVWGNPGMIEICAE